MTMTKTESRRAKFESLSTDGWYAKHFKKLSQDNLKFCREWITQFGELPDGEWEHKCNMMWIDRSGEKPKQAMVMLELLSVCRRGLS